MNAKLEERKKAIKSEFDSLNEQRESLVEKRKELDQKLSQVQVRQVQLQGAHAEVEELLKVGAAPVVEAEIVEEPK